MPSRWPVQPQGSAGSEDRSPDPGPKRPQRGSFTHPVCPMRERPARRRARRAWARVAEGCGPMPGRHQMEPGRWAPWQRTVPEGTGCFGGRGLLSACEPLPVFLPYGCENTGGLTRCAGCPHTHDTHAHPGNLAWDDICSRPHPLALLHVRQSWFPAPVTRVLLCGPPCLLVPTALSGPHSKPSWVLSSPCVGVGNNLETRAGSPGCLHCLLAHATSRQPSQMPR